MKTMIVLILTYLGIAGLWANVMFADDKPFEPSKFSDNAIKKQVPLRPLKRFDTPISSAFLYKLNDEKVGERWYYKTRIVARELSFKGNVLHGKAHFYYPDGKPYWEKTYKNGLLDGSCRYWSKDGKLMGESIMRKGTGALKEYKPDGSLSSITHYMHGVEHGRFTEWGNFSGDAPLSYSTGCYENGKSEGWWRTYTSDGVLIEESMYKDGRRHGVKRQWNQAGVLIFDTPKYYIDYKEVTKEELVKAAKTDRILYRSLHSISNLPPKKNKK